MTDYNELERAVLAAVIFDGAAPAKVFDVPEHAEIRLAEGAGHLLTGATLTAWDLSDVTTGRSE